MDLGSCKVGAAVAVSDMGRATDFYEQTLGLSSQQETGDGGRTFACGDGTSIHVFPSPNARPSGATVAAWSVPDIGEAVDDLTARGVSFEHYDEPPLSTDERGISAAGRSAWFKDPEGNVLALVEAG